MGRRGRSPATSASGEKKKANQELLIPLEEEGKGGRNAPRERKKA